MKIVVTKIFIPISYEVSKYLFSLIDSTIMKAMYRELHAKGDGSSRKALTLSPSLATDVTIKREPVCHESVVAETDDSSITSRKLQPRQTFTVSRGGLVPGSQREDGRRAFGDASRNLQTLKSNPLNKGIFYFTGY